jgi:hypothetical protein
MVEICFACGKPITGKPRMVVTADGGQMPYVGPSCFRQIEKAGEAVGWQPTSKHGRNGPRLFPLPSSAPSIASDPSYARGHTPGPWHLEARAVGYELTAGVNRVRLGFFEEGPGLGYAAEANLRLIATAPALLAALRAMVSAHDQEDIAALLEAFHQARGAIAQAERG